MYEYRWPYTAQFLTPAALFQKITHKTVSLIPLLYLLILPHNFIYMSFSFNF